MQQSCLVQQLFKSLFQKYIGGREATYSVLGVRLVFLHYLSRPSHASSLSCRVRAVCLQSVPMCAVPHISRIIHLKCWLDSSGWFRVIDQHGVLSTMGLTGTQDGRSDLQRAANTAFFPEVHTSLRARITLINIIICKTWYKKDGRRLSLSLPAGRNPSYDKFVCSHMSECLKHHVQRSSSQ